MTRPVDWSARERARDPACSWIVQAPAGSGKTELLTQRMLGLLARVDQPEEVIAITFTRKAAAEMSNRLIRRLQSAAAEPDKKREPHEQASFELARAALKNDLERGWNLLEQPSRLRIRTIDRLCSELARQLPILSGLGGGQQVAEDPEAFYRVAAARTMTALEDSSDPLQADVARVLDRYDNQYDRLVDLLTHMLGHREQWISHLLDIQTGDGFDRDGLEDALRMLIEAELRAARESIPAGVLHELPRYLNYALGNLPPDDTSVRALLEACGGIKCSTLDLPVSADALKHWITLIGFLLTKGGKWWSSPTAALGFPAPSAAKGEEKVLRQSWKDGFTELLAVLRDNIELLDQFNTIRKLPRPDYEEEAWESLESLMRILIRAFQEWRIVMSETGQADFSEIAARAIEALGSDDQPSNLAMRMDYRIEHLLVDEFQDTSLSQIRLLEKLTAGWSDGDGRTLFLVGDPMQSIYRFRKAEVSLFIQAFEGQLFRHIRLRPLQLQVNFRSNRPLVQWVNTVFPDVMPRHSDPVRDAVHYRESCARPGAPPDGDLDVRILPARDDAEEAGQVVEIIRQSRPEHTVAVLVRSRTHASEILALLDRLKADDERYRYQAIEFNPLANTPLVQDLISLTLALTQPADRLAWLSVLRAPCCGISLADLDQLAEGNPEGILLDQLKFHAHPDSNHDEHLAISVDGRQRLKRITPVLAAVCARRGREPIRELVESAWNSLGGPACANNVSELDDAATFLTLLEALEHENLPVDRDTLAQRMKNLHAEPDALAGGKLQVMTIYAAKGLQFDTVILPGLNLKTGNDRGRLLHWFELAGQNRIVLSPMRNADEKARQKNEGDLIQFIADIEKRRQSLENGRLLYVAVTRAICNLHMFAAVTPLKSGQVKPAAGTLLSELWPAIKAEQAPQVQAAHEPMTSELAVPDTDKEDSGDSAPVNLYVPQEYRRLAADWQLPKPPPCVRLAPAESPELRDFIEFQWAGEDARLTGNLVHRLLQLIASQGIGCWGETGGMASREAWCRRQLASEGVHGAKADNIVNRVSEAIENCLDSEHGQWILGARENARSEYALTAVLDHQPVNLVLDRTFIDKGIRWIIDYKTSSHRGGDLEGFLENETERYRDQLSQYRQAMAIGESRPIKTALYFPLLDRFCEVRP